MRKGSGERERWREGDGRRKIEQRREGERREEEAGRSPLGSAVAASSTDSKSGGLQIPAASVMESWREPLSWSEM